MSGCTWQTQRRLTCLCHKHTHTHSHKASTREGKSDAPRQVESRAIFMGPDALPHVKCSGTRFCAGSSGQSLLHPYTRLCVLSQPREHRHSPAATVSGGTHLPRAHESLNSCLSSLGLWRRWRRHRSGSVPEVRSLEPRNAGRWAGTACLAPCQGTG